MQKSKYLDPDTLSKIGPLDVVTRQVVEGIRIGMHRSPVRGISTEFSAYRQYVAGDEIRHIDWKLYGRTNRYHVKLFDAETNFVANLLLDASSSMTFASGKISKLEYAKYMAASLTMDRNNTDRLTVLLDECQRMGIPILPPDINESALNFTPTEDGIRFGLAAIKNVGEGAAQSVVENRIEHGPSTTLFEFCDRLDLRSVNRRVIESLVAAGALDSLEGHRAQRDRRLALEAALERREAQRARGARRTR